MATLEVYEPPVGCGVGTCGPDAEEDLAGFGATLEWLEQRGVAIARYNLGLEPEAFAANPGVKGAIKEHGIACLPLVIADGKVISERRYPSRGEITDQLGDAFRER
jgi:hypothetical protein